MGKRNPKKGQQANNLVFDAKERKDFLLGFRARKQARQAKAAEKVAKKMKEQKARMMAKRKDEMAQMCSASGMPLPEVEHLIEKVDEYEMDDQIVIISAIDSYEAAKEAGLCLGTNEGPSKSNKKKRKHQES